MYSLYIVEDNPNIINKLKKLPFADYSLELVGTCDNGLAASEIIIKTNPDLVITDIEMPGINGIELIRNVVSSGAKTKFIILSGHDEFSFAQNAIKLGVIDYLLKPIIPSQLIDSLKGAVNQLENETNQTSKNNEINQLLENNKKIIKEKFVKELFHGNKYSENEFKEKCSLLNLPFEQKSFRCISVKLINYALQLSKQSESIYNIIQKAIPNNCCYTKFNENVMYAILYFENEDTIFVSKDRLTSALSKIAVNISSICHNTVIFGVSDTVSHYTDICTAYTQAKACLRYHTFFENKSVLFYSDVLELKTTDITMSAYSREKLSAFLHERDYLTAQHYVKSVLKDITSDEKNLNYAKLISTEIYLKIYSSVYNINETDDTNLSNDAVNQINSISSSRQLFTFFDNFFSKLQKMFSTSYTNEEKLVQSIIAYTKINYGEELTIQNVAEEFKISASHLRNVFSKIMNTTYKDYLTDIRMKEAHALLATGNYKVYEVSLMVGYKKTDHFSKLYKQYYGTTPTQK